MTPDNLKRANAIMQELEFLKGYILKIEAQFKETHRNCTIKHFTEYLNHKDPHIKVFVAMDQKPRISSHPQVEYVGHCNELFYINPLDLIATSLIKAGKRQQQLMRELKKL
jgi:hypothetical protein